MFIGWGGGVGWGGGQGEVYIHLQEDDGQDDEAQEEVHQKHPGHLER